MMKQERRWWWLWRKEEMPEDVLMEILSRLRVKNLVRFKSVCKTWLRLISSHHFVQLHLKKSSFRVIRLAPFFSFPCPHSLMPPGAVLSDNIGMRFVGSCDGLVCLYNRLYGIAYIWNPTLHRAICISVRRPSQDVLYYWFGHGGEDDEYKLILGTSSCMHLIRPYIDDNSWKSTQDVKKNYIFFEEYVGTLVNSTVHWIVLERLSDLTIVCAILSYDLGNETIEEISTPEMAGSTCFGLGEVHGCLSIMFGNGVHVELWAMREYGVKESWTKLMSLPISSALHYRIIDRYYDEREFVLDDPTKVRSPLYSEMMYVESLVSPKPKDSTKMMYYISREMVELA